jgi:hypothetical protein
MVFELQKCITCDAEFDDGAFWIKVKGADYGNTMEFMFCSDTCLKKSGYMTLDRSEYRRCIKCDRVSVKCVFGGCTDQELKAIRSYESLVQTQRNECGHEERWIYSRRSGHPPDVMMVAVVDLKKQ